MPLILENAPDVRFREVAGLFVASFERPTALETSTKTSLKTGTETSTKTDLKPSLEHQENTKEAPRKHQEALLQHLRQHPRASIPALMQATGLSTSGVRHHLDQLKRTGQLRRHGPTKGGYWEVIGESR